ncbi:MAG TPA: metallopeptidase TldD-related protein [Blastocatellia bacterium]|nr:metallopeptidase TldD-related protein [Blastocatellia bacterium]
MQQELTKDFAADLVRKAVGKGASAAEVILRERTEFSVTLRFGDVEMLKQSTDRGFGLRVLLDGRQASVSGSDFSTDAINESIVQAIEMARVTSPDDSAGLPELNELARQIPELDLFDPAVASISTEERIEMAKRAEQEARDTSSKIVNFDGGGFDSSYGFMVLANSLGFVGEYWGSNCSLTVVPVASENGKMQRDYWYDVRRKLSDLDSPERIGAEAARRALRKLGARAVPSQTVPVVFEANVARELIGDIFEAVSGESIFRKASFMVGQLGETVASTNVTVVDDGLIKSALGSRPFDGEGLPTRQTTVVDHGVLTSYLLNTYTARKLAMRSTGNASRALVGNPGVGPGNLYLQPGKHTPAQVIGSVSNGLYVTELLGFGVNVVNGDYSRSASGMWIENGELAFPVQGVTIAGNLKEMLASVEMVADDLEHRGTIVSPTLLIGRMTVSA